MAKTNCKSLTHKEKTLCGKNKCAHTSTPLEVNVNDWSQRYLALSIPGSRLNTRNARQALVIVTVNRLKKFHRSNETANIEHHKNVYMNYFYKMQTLVYPRSQNIEAWMVKTMSAGCVNTVVAC